jgi:nucleoside-diphosphate-sugar epimerase
VRALVAGGAGFIGSAVCRALLERGHETVCLDNLVTGSIDNVSELMSLPAFTFVESNVTQAPLVGVDLILHLASPASPVHYKELPIETMLANSAGTHRLLALAEDVGARFVFASTSEVYGDPLEHPQRESYWGNVNPIGARACYDESKRFGEALTFEYRRTRGINASVVRIFNTFGPRMNVDDGRVVPEFIAAALAGRALPIFGDGTQTRSFCYVDDLVEALLLVALDASADGEVFNAGNPYEVTMIDLAREIAAVCGVPLRLEHMPAADDDPQRRRPDISRIRARYGWEPRITLRAGLDATVAYFRSWSNGRPEIAA